MQIKFIESLAHMNELYEKDELIGLFNVDDEIYHSGPGLNHSKLKKIFPPNTPLDFKYNLTKKSESSKAMDFGNAVHIAIFQHDTFDERIAVAPEVNKRTKKGKEEFAEFEKLNEGKLVITQQEFDSCYRIMESVLQHPKIGGLLQKRIGPELAGFFKHGNTVCKFKVDYALMQQKIIIDLKTTISGHPYSFEKSVKDYWYHTQMAFYLLGMSILTKSDFSDVIWIVVEKTPPHKIYLYSPETFWMERAYEYIFGAFKKIEECEKSGTWPSVSDEIKILRAPRWMREEVIEWS